MSQNEVPGYIYGLGPLEKLRLEREESFRSGSFRVRMRSRVTDTESYTHMNDIIGLDWKQIELFKNKIRFDFDVAEVEIKDGQIVHTIDDHNTQIMNYTEENLIECLNFYFKRRGNITESLVIWESQLLKYLHPLQINYCLSISQQPESWDFLKSCTGQLQFLPIFCEIDKEFMKIPIVAESRGIIFHKEVPNEIIFASNQHYFMVKDHIVPVDQLKVVYEHWKSIKREDGMFNFDCPLEVYQQYKEKFKTWARHYYKPVFGFDENGISKGLCLDFHSDKQIVFLFGKLPKDEKTRLVMAIFERDITDIAADYLQKLIVSNPILSITKKIIRKD
uniref:FBA_2 domain-containing protein n=1 Tax=Caenorhabditis tropicalis TaxID=1561998 RepID=A0A1I7T4C1_9PELO